MLQWRVPRQFSFLLVFSIGLGLPACSPEPDGARSPGLRAVGSEAQVVEASPQDASLAVLGAMRAVGVLQVASAEPDSTAGTVPSGSTNPYVFRGDGPFPTFPLPSGDPEPLGPAVFASGFRDPLPQSPVWNPPGAKRVGIQVGHWFTDETPHELRRLSPGSSAGGWAEWQLNLLIALQAKQFLEEKGVEVDLLGSTIPVRYRAHAFVAVHADGDTGGRFSGYKIARSGFSSIPEVDNDFVKALYDEYAKATGLGRDSDDHISRRMIYYYAFNTRRYQHALDLGTPAAIIETGFLTSGSDRAFLTSRPELPGRGIANGVLRFLELEYGATEADH